MATVEPFHGIRYNPKKIASLAEVVTPPYDVISEQQQAEYYDRNPYNIIRVELGPALADDDETANAHTRARDHLQEWQSREVLVRDTAASYYLVATSYAAEPAPLTRWGLIAQVGLEAFGAQGHILPHEQTFPQIKSERLGLMRVSGLNTSPIFALFNDQDDLMHRLQAQAGRSKPTIEFQDEDGAGHRMWQMVDPDEHVVIQNAFKDRRLYIADGHHRYETCLAYRDECARNTEHFNDRHPANKTLMYISSMQDPGLQVLPTHRALPTVASRLRNDFTRRAQDCFDLQVITAAGGDRHADTKQLCTALEALPAEEGLGVAIRGDDRLHLLRLKPDAAARVYAAEIPTPLRQLNVTLLTAYVLPQLLEMSPTELDDAQNIHFRHNAVSTVAAVRQGDYDMAFILKATPIQQVRAIAESGLYMPRKTTYFAPKVITGLVMRALHPDT
jgi:uncharacterized protein (DUF1015 family)